MRDAVAHAELLLHRLKVDIGRLHLDRVGEDERAEANHGRVVAVAVAVLGAAVLVAVTRHDLVAARGVELLHHGLDFLGRREDCLHVLALQDVPQRIDRVVAHRIRENHGHGVGVLHHGRHAVLMSDLRRDFLRHLGVNRGGVDAHVLDAELVGDRAEHVVLRHGARGDEHVKRGLVALAHRRGGGFELFGRHIPRFAQELQHIFVIRCHGCRRIL